MRIPVSRFLPVVLAPLLVAPALAQVYNPPQTTLGGSFTTGGALTIANLATANQVLYTTSANNVGGLATGNNGVLITSGAGVPSISSTLPSAVQANITAVGTQTGALPMTVGQPITWGGSLGIGSFSTSTFIRPTNGTGTNGVIIQTVSGVNLLSCLNSSLCQFGTGAVPVHIGTSQLTAPALTSCGTGSPAIAGTDTAGTVTTGTNATGCVITFNVAYTAAPDCVVTWQSTPAASQSYAISTSAITLTQTSASGRVVNYHCLARSGG